MHRTVGWHIEAEFHEVGTETRATMLLRLLDGTELRANGRAHRNPADPEQPRVGEELAAARALEELARRLRRKAGTEIEEVTHEAAHLA